VFFSPGHINMNDDLFVVSINEEGKRSLRRFAQLSLAVLIVALIASIVEVVSSVVAFQKAMRFVNDQKVRRNLTVSTVYVLINFALMIVQIVFYRRFAIMINRSINYSDSPAFNQSFRFLFLQSACFLLQLILGLLFIMARLVILF